MLLIQIMYKYDEYKKRFLFQIEEIKFLQKINIKSYVY